jgi:threonylcarbamoyladenosine tRNA methylthiotransferase MtaB
MFPNIEILEDKTKLFNKPQQQIAFHFDKHSRAFVKIQDGCHSFCSYCIIPYVRNVLWSKPENEIICEITDLVKNGYSEIVLTGIHIGKHNDGLSNIIEKIIQIPLNFRIRISSIELNEIDNKLIELLRTNQEKICSHLHIPLQSGSDDILKHMKRKYITKAYEEKINKIISYIPHLALTTDIITGFPGETEKHHRETCNLVNRIPFAKLHIFRYSDRHGTKASMLTNKVMPNEIKNRAKDLLEIDHVKRKEFLSKNIGTIRKAVKIGEKKALTDNYITTYAQKEELIKKNGIFETKITEKSTI